MFMGKKGDQDAHTPKREKKADVRSGGGGDPRRKGVPQKALDTEKDRQGEGTTMTKNWTKRPHFVLTTAAGKSAAKEKKEGPAAPGRKGQGLLLEAIKTVTCEEERREGKKDLPLRFNGSFAKKIFAEGNIPGGGGKRRIV